MPTGRGMSTLMFELEPLAVDLHVTDRNLTVDLADGRSLSVPLAWYPRLAQATEAELANWRLLGGGYAIEWPDLDEHIGIEGLLAGRRSGESEASLKRWMASRGIQASPAERSTKKEPLSRGVPLRLEAVTPDYV